MKKKSYFSLRIYKIIISMICSFAIMSLIFCSYKNIKFYIFFVLMAFIIYKIMAIMNRRLFVVSLIGGSFFSIALVTGSNILSKRSISLNFKMYMSIIAFLFIFFTLTAAIIGYIGKLKYKLYNNCIQRGLKKYFNGSLKYFLVVWVIIFICYLPTLLATYPGLFTYDVSNQLSQYFTGEITRFHPPLHTLYLGICFSIGKNLFNSNNIGMLIYSLSQMLIMSATFSYCCYFLAKDKIPIILQVISILFFALFPVNQIFSVTTTKDVLFSAAFLLVVIFTIDIISNSEKFFSSYWLQLRYIFCVILMFSLRNNGYYVFLLCIPVMLIVFRKKFLHMLFICISCVLVWNIITGPIYTKLNIGQGNIREVLSIPIHQLTGVMSCNYKELNNREKSDISNLIGDINGLKESYGVNSADYEKANFNTNIFKSNSKYYIKEYIKIGLKFPKTYMYAFLNNTLPAWYPEYTYNDYRLYKNPRIYMHFPYIEYDYVSNEFVSIKQHSKIPVLGKIIKEICYNDSYKKIPILSMLFRPGFMFWVLFISILICLYERKYKMLLPLFILLSLWISVLFGPVTLVRYLYPLFVDFPLMLMIVFKNNEN
ncbi:MAG: DUF6020 family protein [Clostridium sp.]|nr:DUF6020 family protein [Clostridium sp.]